MAGPAGLIVMVGGIAFKVATSKAAKQLINRFKDARLVKNPTPAQVNSAATLRQYQQKDLSFFSKPQLKKLIKADSKEVTIPQALLGKGYRNPADPKIPASGERARKNIKNVAGGVGAGATVGGVVVKVAKSAGDKIKNMTDEAAMNKEIRKEAIKAGYTKEEAAKVVDQNADFVAGKTTKLNLNLKNRKRFEGEADLPYAKSPIMNKGGVPKPRKKPYVPIYTPDVYAKFPQFKGLSPKEKDRKIAMSTESTRMGVTRTPPPKPRKKPTPPKLAKGGFPDLTGDGKVTKKDVLKARGVAMNKGGMKKQYGAKNFMYGGSVMGKKKK